MAAAGRPAARAAADRGTLGLADRALIIVCDWLPPAFGAVGQYEFARAHEAAAAGRRVTLIGLGARADHIPARPGAPEIIRLAASPPNKSSLVQRALWAIGMNFALLSALAAAARKDRDVEIKVTGSPPFFSYLAILWARLVRRRFITYRITDFYPETAFAAGAAGALRPFAPLIHALRRQADAVEALSGCQRRRLLESGVDPARIAIVRDASPVAFSAETAAAPRPFAEDDVVLLYSGNLGVAHDWRTFAEAYRIHVLQGPNRVKLWLNGGGVGADALLAFCERHALPVHRTPPAPIEALAGVLRAADAHLILLGDAFWGYVFPSKTYGCLASGRPSLYVGPAESDVAALLAPDPQNHALRQGDVSGVLEALARLRPARR